jgi:hypothetical protein
MVAWDLEDVEAMVSRRHELGQGWLAEDVVVR